MKMIMVLAASMSVNAELPAPLAPQSELEKEVVSTYQKIGFSNYQDSLLGVEGLQAKIENFIKMTKAGQNEAQLNKALDEVKASWTYEARIPYSQSEIYRFVNGPIDFEAIDDGVDTYLETIGFEGVEGLVNAWPLDEAYIDYVEGDATTGLINDPSVVLDSDTITVMNERDGEKNISTGYHAIEFILWGQDRDLNGPGQRPVADFTSNTSADRRKAYLSLTTEVLKNHLETVTGQWNPQVVNYTTELFQRDSKDVISDMFVAMISMIGDELKSERIENALLLEDQEEEQSCFSDTTVNDIFGNYLGAKNLYLGTYSAFNRAELSVAGTGVEALVSLVAPNLDLRIKESFVTIETALAEFYGVSIQDLKYGQNEIKLPFDKAIVQDQAKVEAIIAGLEDLDNALKDAQRVLGYVK